MLIIIRISLEIQNQNYYMIKEILQRTKYYEMDGVHERLALVILNINNNS